MRQELPLHIFIRNSIIVSLLFFIISGFIIEKRRQNNGEKPIFKNTIFKNNDIMQYNDYDIINSLNTNPVKSDFMYNDSLIALSNYIYTDTFFNKHSSMLSGVYVLPR